MAEKGLGDITDIETKLKFKEVFSSILAKQKHLPQKKKQRKEKRTKGNYVKFTK